MASQRSIGVLLGRATDLCPDWFRSKRMVLHDDAGNPTDSEYEQIQVPTDGPEFFPIADRTEGVVRVHDPARISHYFIMATVVGAAEQRGWTTGISDSNVAEQVHTGVVYGSRTPAGFGRKLGEGTGTSETHALLAAFVAALEAEQKQ